MTGIGAQTGTTDGAAGWAERVETAPVALQRAGRCLSSLAREATTHRRAGQEGSAKARNGRQEDTFWGRGSFEK